MLEGTEGSWCRSGDMRSRTTTPGRSIGRRTKRGTWNMTGPTLYETRKVGGPVTGVPREESLKGGKKTVTDLGRVGSTGSNVYGGGPSGVDGPSSR